jgi:hypothetical protein
VSRKKATSGIAKSRAELEEIDISESWTEDMRAAFRAMRMEHQAFLVEYLENGFNAAAAYRKAFSQPTMDNDTAASCGSRLIRSAKVRAFLEKIKDDAFEDFFIILRSFRDAAQNAVKPIFAKDGDGQPCHVEDLPDHDARVKGGQALAKLRGFNAPEKVQDDRLTALLQHMTRNQGGPNGQETRQPPAHPGKAPRGR